MNINKNLSNNNEHYLNLLGFVDQIDQSYNTPKWHIIGLEKDTQEFYLKNQILKLEFILSKILNTNIEFQIHQLRYSYFNSDILAKSVSIHHKRHRFMPITWKLLRYARLKRSQFFLTNSLHKHLKFGLPYQITGLQLKLGGRWVKERTKPKKTSQKSQFGSFVNTQSNYTTRFMITNTNKKGIHNTKARLGNKNTNYIEKKKYKEIEILGTKEIQRRYVFRLKRSKNLIEKKIKTNIETKNSLATATLSMHQMKINTLNNWKINKIEKYVKKNTINFSNKDITFIKKIIYKLKTPIIFSKFQTKMINNYKQTPSFLLSNNNTKINKTTNKNIIHTNIYRP